MNLDDWNKRIEAIKEALDVMIERNEQTIECLKQCRHLLKGEHYISVVVDNANDGIVAVKGSHGEPEHGRGLQESNSQDDDGLELPHLDPEDSPEILAAMEAESRPDVFRDMGISDEPINFGGAPF